MKGNERMMADQSTPRRTDNTAPDDPARARVRDRLRGWSERLHDPTLRNVIAAVLDAAEPLSPLGAQMLWLAQPALGLLLPHDEIDSLAQILDEPGGLAALRAALRADEPKKDS